MEFLCWSFKREMDIMEGMGYTRSAVFGFGWSSLHQLGSGLITAAKLAILARFLAPHDFGLASLVAIAIGITESFTQTGVNVTFIQSQRPVSYYIDTAWVIAIIRGFIIGILVAMLGGFFSSLYNEPSLRMIGLVAALVPVIKGFINPAIVQFQKSLNFRADSLYKLTNLLVEASVTVSIALLYMPSVWAFVGGMLAAACFEVVLSWVVCAPKPAFIYTASKAKDILGNATGLSIGAVLSYLADNLDNVIVGKLLGVSVLGGYQNAYALSHKFTYNIAYAFGHSTLPVFAKVASEKDRLRRAFIKSLVSLTALLITLSIPFILFPSRVVEIVYGAQWGYLAALVPWLAVAGIIHGLFTTAYTVCIAKKSYLSMNLHRISVLLLFVVLAWILASKYGVLGVGAALLLSRLILLPPALLMAYKVAQQ